MIKKIIFSVWIVLILGVGAFPQEKDDKWQRLSGAWTVSAGVAVQSQPKSVQWNMYNLLNLNTIITLDPINSFNAISADIKLFERHETPSEFLISFAVTSESQSWFYHMYAFKFTGGFWGIDKVSFIYSDRIDITKPLREKNNFFVKEIASSKCKIKYDQTYNYRIKFHGTDVILYINNEKILSVPFPEKSYDGRIALSVLNVKVAIDKISVKQDDIIRFEDDFNEDTIYVKTVRARKVSAAEEDSVPPEKKDNKKK